MQRELHRFFHSTNPFMASSGHYIPTEAKKMCCSLNAFGIYRGAYAIMISFSNDFNTVYPVTFLKVSFYLFIFKHFFSFFK